MNSISIIPVYKLLLFPKIYGLRITGYLKGSQENEPLILLQQGNAIESDCLKVWKIVF